MNLIPNGRIWIDSKQGAFLGYGRIELLEKIVETGSLRKASIEMKMSYQQAWKLVQQMNERTGEPLIILHRGGKNGGIAIVTPNGLKAISIFKQFNTAFQEFLSSTTLKL